MYSTILNELYHYGILGQKWGIRRFQNPDGTWTEAGKARYSNIKTMKKESRAEVRADNKKAFILGRNATIDSNAYYIANKKAQKAQFKYDQKPTNRRLNNLEVKQRTAERLDKQAKESKRVAEEHISELISKYGSQAIKELSYDKKGRVQEDVHTVGESVATGILSMVGTASIYALGGYGFVYAYPKSPYQLGAQEYQKTLREEKKAQRG